MWNIFKKPFNQESLDSWSKLLDDVAKIAILAIPVVLYSPNSTGYKIANAILLIVFVYLGLFCADFIRKNKSSLTSKE